MEIINKDILTVERGIICHQCNCVGAMGAGLAKDIRDRWFHIYEDYHLAVRKRELELGGCRIAMAEAGIFIAHLAGQYDIGRSKQQTDYQAVRSAIQELRRQIHGSYVLMRMPIYFPYGFGCGLGGGDWNEVYKILEEEIPGAVICKKD